MNDRIRIQNFLTLVAREFDFPVVVYDGGVARIGQESLKPKSSLSNETASNFQTDGKQGRFEARRRTNWTFELVLEFDREVVLEGFEESLTAPVLRLPKEDGKAYSNVAIRLLRTEADHPVQQQPSRGTIATLTFEVDPPRI